MNTALRRPLVPLALATALFLSGCSLGAPAEFEETDAPQGSEQAAAQTSAPDEEEDTSDTAEQSAEAAGIDLAELGDPIATVTVPAVVGEDPEATMDVALYTLRRDGETLILNGSFTVNSEDGEQEERQLFHYLGNHGWAPHLIDTANLTRHDVLASAPTMAMTPSQSLGFRPGQTFYVYAAFAAPPADVESINVQLVDGAPMIVDVPIR